MTFLEIFNTSDKGKMMDSKKITRLIFSIILILFSLPSNAEEESLEMQYCQTTSGYHQRTLDNCLYLMGEVAEHQVKNFDPDGYKASSNIVKAKCNKVEEQLAREGVGSGGAIVMAECFANGWASIRNEMFQSHFR